MKKFLPVIVLCLFFFAEYFLIVVGSLPPYQADTGEGWFEGWSYRKAHNVTGSDTIQMNYPILLTVRYDAGFDHEGIVFLHGKCRNDFGDIRFTDSTGVTLIDYWILDKTDAVQAVCWLEIPYIPQNPDYATFYIYYGNSTASTSSNREWTMNLATDFEDGTTQDWIISWTSHVTWDDVVYGSGYHGYYCRGAGRVYGSSAAGNGHFYEQFKHSLTLPEGSYMIEGAARFGIQDGFKIPQELSLYMNEIEVDDVTTPGTAWHWLTGNITVATTTQIVVAFEFHLYTSGLSYGGDDYYIDYIFVRKWCDPEPSHGSWGTEETSPDHTPPEILSVNWVTTSPPPYVPLLTPRQGEPVLIQSEVVDAENELDYVMLSHRVDGGNWVNNTMIFNATRSLWEAVIPGQLGNTTVEFFVTAADNSGNKVYGSIYMYEVEALPIGDINGDGKVDMQDIFITILHYGEEN